MHTETRVRARVCFVTVDAAAVALRPKTMVPTAGGEQSGGGGSNGSW